MCELLAMSANTPTDLCFSFTGLTRRGGQTGPHKDGWGVAFYEGKGVRAFHDADASA
ncbi:MAG TPA: class II glutamine amidotransferase, partial [Marinobacter adhaerens]|nr:class II glutamine amidotransferase [Marinobacter adhaerens]